MNITASQDMTNELFTLITKYCVFDVLCLMSPEQMNPSLGHEEDEQHQGHESAPVHHVVSARPRVVSSSSLITLTLCSQK